jgi:diaminohydroxyphosphoribosylaminopyrimidine deaminase/5-amino-6-(5-phosphoribosylamino)uracil reductase
VHNGEIVGEGWHEYYGGPHAEVNALTRAGIAANGAELYVTLEPCTSYDKTPPCSLAIINAGVKKIYIGTADPNEKNAGKAFEVLRKAGVDVVYGVLANECALLIQDFTKYITTKIPYVTLKIAQSLDGKIATSTGESKWITGEESRKQVHQLRCESDIILVGVDTVIADDPELTVRLVSADRQPARAVLDSKCRIPITSKLVQSAKDTPTLVFTSRRADKHKIENLRGLGVDVYVENTEGEYISLPNVLKRIGGLEMMNIMVEGGSRVFGSFLNNNLADAVNVFIAPFFIGGETSKASVGGFGLERLADSRRMTDISIQCLGEDIWFKGLYRVEDSLCLQEL